MTKFSKNVKYLWGLVCWYVGMSAESAILFAHALIVTSILIIKSQLIVGAASQQGVGKLNCQSDVL